VAATATGVVEAGTRLADETAPAVTGALRANSSNEALIELLLPK
jgi:hypothetical protein